MGEPTGCDQAPGADAKVRARKRCLDDGERLAFTRRGFARNKGAVMSNRLSLLVLAAALGLGAQATPSLAQQSSQAAFEALKNGGYVVVIRHGRTNESPAN